MAPLQTMGHGSVHVSTMRAVVTEIPALGQKMVQSTQSLRQFLPLQKGPNILDTKFFFFR